MRGVLVVIGSLSVELGCGGKQASPSVARIERAEQAPATVSSARHESSRAPMPDLDPDHWITAAVSTLTLELSPEAEKSAEIPSLPRKSCMLDMGCPTPEARLPPCPAHVDTISVDEASARASELIGHTVMLRGALTVWGVVTEVSCGWRCCNDFGGALIVQNVPPSSTHESIGLLARGSSAAFACYGDESRACCGFAQEAEVVVWGTLERSGGPQVKLVIAEPRLCNPSAADEGQATVAPRGDGCTYEGRVYSSHETFVTGAGVCGCFYGALHCAAQAGKYCFLKGQWFYEGARVSYGRFCGSVCHAGAWQTDHRTCRAKLFDRIEFPPNGTTVPNDAHTTALLDTIARSAIEERLIVEIHGDVNPTEGKRAAALALERARAVARAFAKRGVPRKNIRAIGRTEPRADAVNHQAPRSAVGLKMFPVEWRKP
jgi:hypothetical protein